MKILNHHNCQRIFNFFIITGLESRNQIFFTKFDCGFPFFIHPL